MANQYERQPIILACGAHAESGKTTVLCSLLGALRGWGALKISPVALYTSIVDDPNILSRPGSDTARYLEAGAAGVVFLRARREDVPEDFPVAFERLAGFHGVLIEGNSAIELCSPDIVIFTFGEQEKLKESARPLLERADVIVYRDVPPEGAEELEARGVRLFRGDELKALVEFVTKSLEELKS
jgi:molybdopterin-guanine dinucleotide biosynthesis protein